MKFQVWIGFFIVANIQDFTLGFSKSCYCGQIKLGATIKSKVGKISGDKCNDVLEEMDKVYSDTLRKAKLTDMQKIDNLKPKLHKNLKTCCGSMSNILVNINPEIVIIKENINTIIKNSKSYNITGSTPEFKDIVELQTFQNVIDPEYLCGIQSPLNDVKLQVKIKQRQMKEDESPLCNGMMKQYLDSCADFAKDIMECYFTTFENKMRLTFGSLLGSINCFSTDKVILEKSCDTIKNSIDKIVISFLDEINVGMKCLKSKESELNKLDDVDKIVEHCNN